MTASDKLSVAIVGPGLNPFSPPNQLRTYVQEVWKRLPVSIVTNGVEGGGILPRLEQVELREGLFQFITSPAVSKLRQLKPDIIDVEGSLTLTRFVTKMGKLGKPIVFGVHNLDKLFTSDIRRLGGRRFLTILSDGKNSMIPNWLALLKFCYPITLLRKALQCSMIKRIILSTRYAAKFLSRTVDPEKVSILPHGVDTKRFAPYNAIESRLELNLDPDEIIFLYYGSSRMLRGIDKLILSFNQIYLMSHSPKHLKLLLLLLQPAPYYERLICHLGLGKSVQILYGIQKNIERFIDSSDIVCLPFESIVGTVSECPYTILESMSVGKPVISTRIGAIPEIISHKKNGLLVKAGDVSALTSAMLRLALDEKLRQNLGREARNLMIERYGWDTVIPRVKSIYDEVAGYERN